MSTNSLPDKPNELDDALRSVSQALNTSVSLNEILDQVMKVGVDYTGAERGFIALIGDDDENLQYRVAYNFDLEILQSGQFKSGRLALDAVIESGQGFVSLHVGSDARFSQQKNAVAGIPQSILCVPLVVRDGVIGAVYLDHIEEEGKFSEADLQVIDSVASQIALAVWNTRLEYALEQAVESKDKFVSVVTHELRIPMTSIKGYTDLLRQGAVGPVNEQQTEFLIVIRNNVERMSTLVSNLSDLAKMEAGRFKLDCVKVSLQETIEQALREFRPMLDEKKQTLDVNISPDLPQVYADSNRLVQVLRTLVANAFLYTPEMGKITITAWKEDDFLRVEVSDSGIGISSEDQENIFSQFFRSEDSAVREQQGWGLALAVTKLLVEQMGGRIGFQSVLGEGSSFWFVLPTTEAGFNK